MIVVSGGQTGVDRAALDAARMANIAVVGMVPRGWKTEGNEDPDVLRDRYPELVESYSASYPVRTRYNVEHSDAVLLITSHGINGHRGTLLTYRIARRAHIRVAIIALDEDDATLGNKRRILRDGIHAAGGDFHLMIAGPRESGDVGIYDRTLKFLGSCFRRR